jgi:hypothetical protein
VANNGSDSLQFFLQIRWFHTSKIFTIVDWIYNKVEHRIGRSKRPILQLIGIDDDMMAG